MSGLADRIKKELDQLNVEGNAILIEAHEKKEKGGQHIAGRYQAWYTRALPAIRQLLPERYAEFQETYRVEKRKELTYRCTAPGFLDSV